eukprot:Skav222831  [mRNA]  locus=scaffold4760:122663:124910:- [translate_table: standard]
MEVVSTSITSRKGFRNCPVIDRISTIDALAAQPPSAHHALALQMTLTPMTNRQKRHFLPDRDEHCTFCDEPDSVTHQVLHCHATQSVRCQYATVVAELEDRDPIHTLLPVVFRDPYFDSMRVMQFNMHAPTLDFRGHMPLVAFTDGSCLAPTHVNERWAAFSIVCPLVDIDTLNSVPESRYHEIQQQSFFTVAVGHVHGKQTTNRAELTAALLVHEQARGITVITDSAYVLSRHALLQRCPDLSRLHRRSNFDLLARWHTLLWDRQMQTPTIKVKAHSLRDKTVSDPLAYKLGNDVADHVAKHAVAHLCAPYVQQMQHRLTQQEADRKMLSQQFALRTALSQLRTQLLKQADITDTWNPDQVADNFINLEVTSPMPFPLPTDRWEAVHASRYGTEFSELVLHWLQTLVWPTAAEPGRAPVGITLFELAINFLITSQRAILIPVDGGYIDVDRSDEWSRSQCDITRLSACATVASG